MISVATHLADLNDRLDSAVRLVDETHKGVGTTGGSMVGPVSREARGLAVVLVFAAYENLLKSLTQTLLEGAIKCRVGNRRLQPTFQVFAFDSSLRSAMAVEGKDRYTKSLPRLVDTANMPGSRCSINPSSFPSDKSFMRASQIQVWCDLFDVGDPAQLLPNIWSTVNTVVAQRNAIAHGQKTPDEVGRTYTEQDSRDLIEAWRIDWSTFVTHVGQLASTRDFYRTPR